MMRDSLSKRSAQDEASADSAVASPATTASPRRQRAQPMGDEEVADIIASATAAAEVAPDDEPTPASLREDAATEETLNTPQPQEERAQKPPRHEGARSSALASAPPSPPHPTVEDDLGPAAVDGPISPQFMARLVELETMLGRTLGELDRLRDEHKRLLQRWQENASKLHRVTAILDDEADTARAHVARTKPHFGRI